MPHRLLVPRLQIVDSSADPFQITADIALTCRAEDDFGVKLAGRRKVTLQEHVKILPYRLWACIPTPDLTRQRHRYRIDRGGNHDRRAFVET